MKGVLIWEKMKWKIRIKEIDGDESCFGVGVTETERIDGDVGS